MESCGDDVSQDIFSVFHNMIFFLVLGLWPSFWVIRRRRPFPIPSRKFAPRCKENDGSHSALRVAVRCNAPTERGGYSRGPILARARRNKKPPRPEA